MLAPEAEVEIAAISRTLGCSTSSDGDIKLVLLTFILWVVALVAGIAGPTGAWGGFGHAANDADGSTGDDFVTNNRPLARMEDISG
ncbi:hypothetical protein ABZ915_07665 [Streptomyces sp. NPDC046915]|uniref:hypothetical protein n=1 Tax=Streptomyces sp. NPDC046915 TaxID=3155257 RepID=UPI0033D65ABD